jgi:hypothetical protein
MKQIIRTVIMVGALALTALTAGVSAGHMSLADIAPSHTRVAVFSGHHVAVADADIGDGTSPNRKG